MILQQRWRRGSKIRRQLLLLPASRTLQQEPAAPPTHSERRLELLAQTGACKNQCQGDGNERLAETVITIFVWIPSIISA
ncbi:hypothetical protein KIN20_018412 [Parelaphostrongylus tenuis]|uniref:Uncharacterized protein n=1 Tax=Parelaphostrongylus tenuis TaxID=148309 RepID=A0AAD5QPJ7_PARTN|nr:hypothetical protein KIN20_018412 [Parelaphostrongylus tenuis]